MVLPLKRWKSRSSPGIKAGAYEERGGINPFTVKVVLNHGFGMTRRADLNRSAFFVFLLSFGMAENIGGAGWSSPPKPRESEA